MDFYNYYLYLCNSIGMKPSPAGEAAGFTRTAVNGWKRGHLPTDSNLQKLAEFFEIPASNFHECDDIKARDIKQGIKSKVSKLVSNPTEDKKMPVTESDGKDNSPTNEVDAFATSLFRQLPIERKIFLITQMQAELQNLSTRDAPEESD